MVIPGTAIAARRFILYLPDRDRLGNQIETIDYWVTRACVLLAAINGGVTRLAPAQGIWHQDDRVVEETTHIVYTLVMNEEFFAHFHRVIAFITEFATKTNQHAVAVEFDHMLYLITDFPMRVHNEESRL